VITFSPLLIHLDDEIYDFGVSVSAFERLSDDVGIVALVFSEPVDIKAWHLDMIFSTIKEMIYGLNQWDRLVLTLVKEIRSRSDYF
jgi:hypothetical protein